MSVAAETAVRRQRGLAIADFCRIVKNKAGYWLVPSQQGKGRYTVSLDGANPTCTCDDFAKRNEPCKHIFAAREVAEGRVDHVAEGAVVAAADRVNNAKNMLRRTAADRPTYPQDWPAYNLAQTREKAHFQALMADLCRGIVDPPRKPGPGRNSASTRDLAFAAAFKVYSTVSGRRFQADLDEAHGRGYLSRPLRYNTVFEGFDNKGLTPILLSLIAESGRPLAAVETTFAIDSSGFGSTKYARWFDAKYKDMHKEAVWLKCHVMCGVKTNVVTAVEIGDGDSSDIARFVPLLTQTAGIFDVREVSADAIYSTYKNVEAVARLGADPFIALKSNASGARGGAFREMFLLYSLHREEFLRHYHQRSNVESTFSMMKAKFGADLRSKTDTAMKNEVLCKVLAHNVCCVIQSHYELGIAPMFWGDEAGGMKAEEEAMPIDALAWV
jgi:DDE family transposase/SWIM zinc finger